MQTGTKLLSFIAGIGFVGSSSALASHLLTATKVGNILREQGYTFLNFDGDLNTWKTIAKFYSNSQKNRLTEVTIAAVSSGGEATEEDAKKLRKACKDTINSSNYTNKSLILSTSQWCVKPTNIKDLAAKQGTVLDLDTNQDKQPRKWNQKVIDYLRDGETDRISGANLIAHTPNQPAEDRKKLKQGCKSLENKQTYEDDFHDSFTKFQRWCTLDK